MDVAKSDPTNKCRPMSRKAFFCISRTVIRANLSLLDITILCEDDSQETPRCACAARVFRLPHTAFLAALEQLEMLEELWT